MAPTEDLRTTRLSLEDAEGAASLRMVNKFIELITRLNLQPDEEDLKEIWSFEVGNYRVTLIATRIQNPQDLPETVPNLAEQETELITSRSTAEEIRHHFFSEDNYAHELIIENNLGDGCVIESMIAVENNKVTRRENLIKDDGKVRAETGRSGINQEDIFRIINMMTSDPNCFYLFEGSNAESVLKSLINDFRGLADIDEAINGMMDTIDRLREKLQTKVREIDRLNAQLDQPVDTSEIEAEVEKRLRSQLSLENTEDKDTLKLYLTLVVLLFVLSNLAWPYYFKVIHGDDGATDDDDTTLVEKQGDDDDETTEAGGGDEPEESPRYNPTLRAVAENGVQGVFTRVSGNIPNPADARIIEVRQYKEHKTPAHLIRDRKNASYVGFFPPFHENFPLGTTLPRSMAERDPANKDKAAAIDGKGNEASYTFNGDPPTDKYTTPFGEAFKGYVYVMFNEERVMHYWIGNGEIGGGFKADLKTMAENNEEGVNISIVTSDQYHNNNVRIGMPVQAFLDQLEPIR